MYLGTTRSKRGTQKIVGECDHCKNSNCLYAIVYSEIFWIGIPCFPSAKTVELHCSQCKKVYHNNQINNKLYTQVYNVKRSYQSPIWSYLFPIICGIMLPIVFIKNCNKARGNLTELQNIHAADVIVFKSDGSDEYYRGKVCRVKNDTLYVTKSIFAPQKINNLCTLYEEHYSEDTLMYPKQLINRMNFLGQIDKIVSSERQ